MREAGRRGMFKRETKEGENREGCGEDEMAEWEHMRDGSKRNR